MASNNFINECKTPAYEDRLGKITIDGVEYNQSNNLTNLEIDDSIYNNGTIVGNTCIKSLKFSLINVDKDVEFVAKRATPSVGVIYNDNSTEYIDFDEFAIESLNDEQTKNFTDITGYDSLNILDTKYECGLSEGAHTVGEYWLDLVNELGLETETTTFTNSSIVISANPFINNETYRTVLSEIEKVSCTFSKVEKRTRTVNNQEEVYHVINLKWFDDYCDEETTTINESATINNVYKSESIELLGNTSQEGTPTPETPQDIHVVSGDNSIVVCGKNLFNLANYTIQGWDCYIENPMKTEGSYVVSCVNDYPVANKGVALGFTNTIGSLDNGYFCGYVLGASSKSVVHITTQVQANSKYLMIRSSETTNIDRLNSMKIMLEKGNQATTYEEYKGASYPISLGVENLLNVNDRTFSATGSDQYFLSNFALEPTKTYTLSFDYGTNSPTFSSSGALVILKQDNNYASIVSTTDSSGKIIKTITNTSLISLYVTNRLNGGEINISHVQLELGSKANTYTPYGTTPIELCKIGTYQDKIDKSTGKNLFDDTFILGSITQTGQDDNNTTTRARTGYMSLKENTTYSFSSTNSNIYYVPYYYNSSQTFISYDNGWKPQTTPFTTPANTKYVRILIKNNNTNTITLSEITNPMINLGTTATEYEPYGTGWYLKKEIGKVVLNGSENWQLSSGNGFLIYASATTFSQRNKTVYNGFSDKFSIEKSSSTWTNNYYCGWNSYNDFWLKDNDYNTVADFKTWLSNNNTIVYYVLATPTYTKITDAKLIEELDSVELQKGLNNISLIGETTPYLKVKYKSDVPNYEFETSDYSSLEGSLTKYGPVNCVLLGSENISGENVYLQDDESISKNGETKVLIDSQYFLYTQALREQAIQGIYKKLHNFEYYDLSLTTYYGKPFLEVGNKIRVNTNEGNAYDTFILQHTFTYDGTFKSVIKSPALTKQEEIVKSTESVSNRLKHTEIMVDKANQRITSVVEDVSELDSKTTKIEQDLDSVSITVSQTETKVEDLEDSIEYFNVSMLQETVVIPVYNNKKPYSTATYSVDYTAKFKNATVTPTVQISGTETGVTTSSTSSQIKFAVNSSTAIMNNDYTYTIGFSYISEGTTYTSTKKITVVLSIQGEQGEQGGSGRGISSIDYRYATTTTQTTPSASSVTSTTIPELSTTNKYLWQKETITYTSGNPKVTVALIGVYGDTGSQGPAGQDGTDGTSISIVTRAVTYKQGDNGTTPPSGTWSSTVPTVEKGKYLWTKTYVKYSDNTETTSYSVAYNAKDGENGQEGPQGPAGTSVTITTKTVQYQIGNSGTTAPTGTWSNTVPTLVAQKYLWTKTYVKYSDNNEVTSYSVSYIAKDGTDGTNGSDGRGISSATVTYQKSTSGTVTPTGTWQATIPSVGAGEYLWTRTVTNYTTGNPTTSYSVGMMGETGSQGPKGNDGTSITISSKSVTYQIGTSGQTAPTGTWSTTVPEQEEGKYLWTKTYVKYSNNTDTTAYSVSYCARDGEDGQQGPKGSDGKSVSSITEEFYLSTSKTSQTGGSWVTTPPTWVSGKYIWTRSKIVYTNPSSTVYTTPLCSSEWEAVNGINVGGRNYFLKANTFTSGGAGASGITPSVEEGLWKIVVASGNGNWNSWSHENIIEDNFSEGDTFTFSLEIKSEDASTTTPPQIYFKNGMGYYRLAGSVSSEWSRVYYTGTWKDTNNIAFHLGWGGLVGTYYIRKLKFESGNKATDWTPAIEDKDPIYTHTMFSEDGLSFAPEYTEYDKEDPTVIVTHYPIGKKPSKYQGTLVDNNIEDSSIFGDYTWIDTSQYNREEINELQETLSTTVTTVSGLQETIDGLTNTVTSSGGTNLVRDSMGVLNDGSWEGNVESTNFSTSVGQSAIVVNNNTISQTINVKNGLYTLSLKYRKNTNIATGRMDLTVAGVTTQFSESNESGNGYVQQINVTTGTISLSIKGNADNIGYVYDLMLNAGSKVKSWEQNQNETTTDTVKIGKGIEVSSSSQNTTTRMDAGGFRVFSNSSGDVVMEATDKGGSFVELVSSSTSNINGSMFIKVGSQIWETGVSS